MEMQTLQAKHLAIPGKRTTGKSALRRKGAFDHLPRSGLVLVRTIERTIPITYTSAETPSHLRNLHQSLGIEIRLYRMEKHLFDTRACVRGINNPYHEYARWRAWTRGDIHIISQSAFVKTEALIPRLDTDHHLNPAKMHFSSLLPAILAISGMATATAIPSPFLESRQSSPAAGIVYSKCSKPGVFALAFDDGPGQYTEELIKTLNAAGAKATFFFTGTLYGCIYNRASAVKAAYSSGHQVASHTWTHPQTLDSMSVAQLTTETQKLETALVNIIGVKPTYMRPPYLKTGGNVPTAMKSLGYRMITDSIDSQDWNGASASASEQKFRSAGPSTSDGKGHISLMHETYASTVRDLVPRLIKWAKENNLKMVTVAECLGDASGAYAKGTGGGAQTC
jgi:peptidoglycan/xylan/chitin deacetylase (PgdA/CDA1 family)